MNLISAQVQFSCSNIWIKAQIFDNDTEIFSSQGKGSVCISNIALYISDDPIVPSKPAKEDKKQATLQQPIPPKHRYILQATILPSEIEKLSSASSDSNRPNSRNLKSASSAGKKKKSTTQPPPTPPATGQNTGNGNSNMSEVDFSWSLRVVSSESIPLQIQKDTEKEDRYKAIKESWEAAAPGRMNKAKEVREQYLRGIDAGGVKPVVVNYNDQLLKPWTIIKKECPKAVIQRDREIRTPDQKPSLLQRLLNKPSTPSQTAAEIKEDFPIFSVKCNVIGICDTPIILGPQDFESNSLLRAKRIEIQNEIQSETVKNRINDKERRSIMKKKIVDIVEHKLRELEFWNKLDQGRREEYKAKMMIEIEESNAKLRAALDLQSKLSDSAEAAEEQSEKKKKVAKK
jgi:hypothetical protein